MSELLWVSVPSVTDGGPILRVVVVPRLTAFLDESGMADWPDRLGRLDGSVVVEVRQGENVRPIPGVPRHEADPAVWREFFLTGLTVEPWGQPALYDQPVVDPTSRHSRRIDTTYAETARAAVETGAVDTSSRARLGTWGRRALLPMPGASRPWHRPDFHRVVGMLREHPYVLRRLGLVFEVLLDGAILPRTDAGLPAAIRVDAPELGIAVVAPWTRYEFDGTTFLPASTADISRGMVDLAADLEDPGLADGEADPGEPPDARRWRVATVDVTNAVSRLDEAANADASTLPALRSAGLLLLRRDRGSAFAARRQSAAANAQRASMAQAELTADDLVLGYRIDVRRHGSDRWHSLCRRQAAYHVNGLDIGPSHLEEGHVKPLAALADSNGGLLQTDQVVARWNGWSLAVPRPVFGGRPRRRTGRTDRQATMPYRFTWEFTVADHSLPTLRFGEAYQLRARVADLAGGGLEVDDPLADRCASDPVTYTRWEPIPPPQVRGFDEAQAGPGGTVDRLVVRSDPFVGDSPPLLVYPSNAARDLLPPGTTLALAEQHGVLDGAGEDSWEMVRRTVDATAALSDPAARGVAVHLRTAPATTKVRDWPGAWPDYHRLRLELVDGPLGSPPAVEWAGDTATVRLAPGRQVDVELSSYMPSGMRDNFTLWQWIGDLEGEAGTLITGRHPMITPPDVLRLVHAVRRPLGQPRGPLQAERAEGETYVRLLPPEGLPLLGIDPASTVQFDVRAKWTDRRDKPHTLVRDVEASEAVLSVHLRPDQQHLPELRHEFGDTRHRAVTYTLDAFSRFREFFAPEEPDASFHATATVEVNVCSSARPAPPSVLATVPGFRWEQQLVSPDGQRVERVRRGGLLRVEVARPWFSSGLDEQLAAVVWPAGHAGGMPEEVGRLVSLAHRDPIRVTPDPPTILEAHMFAGATPVTADLPHLLTDVQVLPYPVQFERDRWFADVEIPHLAAVSYCPFVQLAVARYQPHSLLGLELSAVVQCEPVQVLPDRRLVLRRTAEGHIVTLEGRGPDTGPNIVTVTLERCELPPSTSSSTVELTAFGPNDLGAPAWQRTSGRQGRLNAPIGPISIPPAEDHGPNVAYRIVVREVEQFEPNPTSVPSPPAIVADLTERTVFLDVVELPA